MAPAEAADPEAERLMEEREVASEASGDYERADRIRDELASRGYEVRDTRRGPAPGSPLVGMTRPRGRERDGAEVVYGSRPVDEARRGRRRVRRVWTTRRPVRSASSLGLPGSPDHQGIVAEVDPYPYADPSALLDPPDALVVALDQVSDPHNLGAVCRSAEAAGASGVVIPERRSATVTAAVAKASAGAVEHLAVARVPNLADWLAQAKEAGAWIYGAEAGRGHAVHEGRPDRDESCWSSGARGRGCGSASPRRATSWCRSRSSGRIGSLNVSAAAAVLLFEAVRQRSGE